MQSSGYKGGCPACASEMTRPCIGAARVLSYGVCGMKATFVLRRCAGGKWIRRALNSGIGKTLSQLARLERISVKSASLWEEADCKGWQGHCGHCPLSEARTPAHTPGQLNAFWLRRGTDSPAFCKLHRKRESKVSDARPLRSSGACHSDPCEQNNARQDHECHNQLTHCLPLNIFDCCRGGGMRQCLHPA